MDNTFIYGFTPGSGTVDECAAAVQQVVEEAASKIVAAPFVGLVVCIAVGFIPGFVGSLILKIFGSLRVPDEANSHPAVGFLARVGLPPGP